MKYPINKLFKGCAFAVSALALATACSDDHFDVVAQGDADKTLWENIQANKNLSEFQDLLTRITVMKSENDKTATLKYSELLASNQSFTVVAPVNGSFDYKAWSDTINKANLLRADEATEREGRQLMYIASNQFAMNHIARFNSNLASEQTIHLLNGKNVQSVPGTFNEIPMEGTQIHGSNAGRIKRLDHVNHLLHLFLADVETLFGDNIV